MKPLFFSLLIFICLPGRSQIIQPDASIRQQLAGLWQLDIKKDSARWEDRMEDIPFVQFLEGERLAVISGISLNVGTYDIAFSDRDTFLIAEDFQAKIKSNRINGNWTVSEIRFDERSGHTYKFFKIGISRPLPINLLNSYNYKGEGGWTIYPPLSAIPYGNLELKEDNSFWWDSLGTGTWNLDSIQARIHFQTPSGLFVYDILKVDYTILVLRLEGTQNPDSVIAFGLSGYVSGDEELNRIQDSVRVADSMAAVAQFEQEYFGWELQMDPSKFGEKFNGSWNAFLVSSPGQQAFTIIWNENGTLILQKGKKEKKYTWELISVEEDFVRLKLTRSGKEELSLMVFFADHVHHEITLIDPFTGKLDSFLLHKSK